MADSGPSSENALETEFRYRAAALPVRRPADADRSSTSIAGQGHAVERWRTRPSDQGEDMVLLRPDGRGGAASVGVRRRAGRRRCAQRARGGRAQSCSAARARPGPRRHRPGRGRRPRLGWGRAGAGGRGRAGDRDARPGRSPTGCIACASRPAASAATYESRRYACARPSPERSRPRTLLGAHLRIARFVKSRCRAGAPTRRIHARPCPPPPSSDPSSAGRAPSSASACTPVRRSPTRTCRASPMVLLNLQRARAPRAAASSRSARAALSEASKVRRGGSSTTARPTAARPRSVKSRFDWVNLVENKHNVRLQRAAATRARRRALGRAADTSHLVFLNNDMRVEPDWLRELVGPARARRVPGRRPRKHALVERQARSTRPAGG